MSRLPVPIIIDKLEVMLVHLMTILVESPDYPEKWVSAQSDRLFWMAEEAWVMAVDFVIEFSQVSWLVVSSILENREDSESSPLPSDLIATFEMDLLTWHWS